MTMKLVKTATALALGASLISTAVVSTDASAASKYKISKGKLVIAKTGKVAKGFVTYKSLVYKNGKKLTGLKGKTYYKAGKKATGTYKGAYYYKGAKKVTTGTYKGAYYVKGVKKVTTGLYNNRYYKSGVKATGTYKGAYYVKGVKKVTTGTYNGAYYVKGFKKVTTGTYNGAYYVKGTKVVTTGLYEDQLFVDGELNKGYKLYEENLFNNAALNEGLVIFEEKLFDGAKPNKGVKEFEGKFYYDTTIANGVYEVEGEKVAFKDGVKLPFVVESVSVINTNLVEVNVVAPKADVLKATVEVLDGKGNVVPVKAVDVSAGDKTIAFTFDKTVTAEDLAGVWTIGGVEYNFDVLNQFAAIKDAKTEISLYKALTEAKINNVKETLVKDYLTAIATAITTDKAKNLADIQVVVDQVNTTKADALKETELVKELNEAAKNEVTFLKALKANFKQVNDAWFTEYKTAITTTITSTETVQKQIDAVNTKQIKAAHDKAFKTLKSADIAEARTLTKTYGADAKKDEFDLKAWGLDSADLLDALVKVNEAPTNNTLNSALVELDALEAKLVEKYKNETAVKVVDEFDIKSVKTELLADYRAAIKTAEVGSKNQRKDIATIISTVNAKALDSEKTSSVATVIALTEKSTDAEVVAALTKVQDAHFVAKAEPALNKVNAAYAAAYKAELLKEDAKKSSAADINTLIGAVNKAENAKAQLLAVKEAKTVAELTTALTVISLENGKPAEYINLSAANKAEVAELVLDAKADLSDVGKIEAAITKAITDRTAAIEAVNDVAKVEFDYAKVDPAISGLKVAAYSNLSNIDKLAAAQKFFANVPTTTVEGKKVVVEYTSLSAIKSDVEKATK